MNNLFNDVAKKIGNLRQELGHNVWLFGLGAYSKSVEEFNGLSSKSRSLLDELVERGREVESSAKERVASTATQTSSALEERMHGMVAKVTGLDKAKLDTLDEKLEKLNKQVESLIEQKKADKPAAKKVVPVAAAKTAKAAPAAAKPKAKAARPRRRVPAKTAE